MQDPTRLAGMPAFNVQPHPPGLVSAAPSQPSLQPETSPAQGGKKKKPLKIMVNKLEDEQQEKNEEVKLPHPMDVEATSPMNMKK